MKCFCVCCNCALNRFCLLLAVKQPNKLSYSLNKQSIECLVAPAGVCLMHPIVFN